MTTKYQREIAAQLIKETCDLTTDELAERIAIQIEILCKKIEDNEEKNASCRPGSALPSESREGAGEPLKTHL